MQIKLRMALALSLFTSAGHADPATPVSSPRLVYATYVGSGRNAVVHGLAVDSAGYVYVGGSVEKQDGSSCGLLTKFDRNASSTVWSICLPVGEVDGVAVDSAGSVYAAGGRLPGTPLPTVATVFKLSSDAQHTIYAAQIPGAYNAKIALDVSGAAYITGMNDTSFQATPGAFMTSGGTGFAMKLNAAGSIEYATYLDITAGLSIGVDSKGLAWVAGVTCPGGLVANPICSTSLTGSAAAIRKLDAAGAHLLASITFGGENGRFFEQYDSALALSVDSDGSVWVTGSDETNSVPTTPGTLEPVRPPGTVPGTGQGGQAYILKLNASGQVLYGTYIGNSVNASGQHVGSSIDSVAIDSQGRPYLGFNVSDFTLYPPGFVMALSVDASSVLLMQQFNSPVQSLVLDGNGGLYIDGNTLALAFVATPGVYQTSFPGGSAAGYIAKFDLTAQATARFSSVVNAATWRPGYSPVYPEGAVAPGEIVTLWGSNFPSNPVVTFDSRAAPILYASPNQINAVVPFEVKPPATVVSVETARGFVLPVFPAVPGLFTANGSGFGQLAALNQDRTVNSSANPAKAGSAVSLFLTGLGTMSPPIADGQAGPLQSPFPTPVLSISAQINKTDAPVLFAGQAPGLIAGAIQLNLHIPEGTPAGDVVVTVYVGNYQTIGSATIAVQ